MTKTAHTPGPWRVANFRTSLVVFSGEDVVVRSAGFEETKHSEANARLIAAAPDLLDALDSLVMACQLPGQHCEVEQALPAALGALAKAEAK